METRRQLERCERMWSEEPVFLISTCTTERRAALNTEPAVNLLVQEWALARKRHGWSVGRYLVMPDEVHFFCAADVSARPLSEWLQIWKEWTSKRLKRELGWEGAKASQTLWRPDFAKHLLHSQESYLQQWRAVHDQPVRANLAGHSEEWPWQGEIEHLS